MLKKIKLDVNNLKLLNELEKNSRAPLSKMAKTIGISKEVTHYRFKKLVESGFIKRFQMLIDYFSLDFKYYRLIVNLHNLKYQIRRTIINELRENKHLDLNVYLLSNWDLEINIWVRHSNDFYDFYSSFIEKYADYIVDKNIYIITRMHFFSHGYLHKHHRVLILGEEKLRREIDEVDMALLKALEEHPRDEILSLGEKLRLSPSTVNYRLKQLLKKNIIKGIFPVLDVNFLGYNKYRVEITLNNLLEKKTLITYLSQQSHVTKITELIGRKDLDFEVDFKTTQELDLFLEELRLKGPHIKDFEVINVVLD